jgi:hypothetical protein
VVPDEHWQEELQVFWKQHRIHILNVAGPRAASAPGIEVFVHSVLDGFSCDQLSKFYRGRRRIRCQGDRMTIDARLSSLRDLVQWIDTNTRKMELLNRASLKQYAGGLSASFFNGALQEIVWVRDFS